jgi:ribosomal protein S12 methylthiotransferase
MSEKEKAPRPIRAGLISLGCAKNLVDGEIMLGGLLKEGIEIVNDPAQADVVIVNTCSFIDSAQEESVEAILESAETRRAANPQQALVVAGCLPQRFREELIELLPEVDAFVGIDQVPKMPEVVRQALARRAASVASGAPKRRTSKEAVKTRIASLAKSAPRPKAAPPIFDITARPTYIPDYATPRFRLTPAHFAYMKIAEGCNHTCSFCVIPQVRGSHRSRPLNDIVSEARLLIDQGVKEINLISQDSTYYGMDLRSGGGGGIASPEKFTATARSLPQNAATICALIRELNELPGDFWIRLLYTHPAHWTDELIQTIAQCRKVARYVDMPLQHIHSSMLERMRRETSQKYIEDLIRRIRAGVPGIALRTTFIVGFPGETDEAFETLLNFMRETRFERAGVFAYSCEAGTRAAKMGAQVPDRVKQQRRERAMAEQQAVSRSIGAAWVGRSMKVLIEGPASADEIKSAGLSWNEPVAGRVSKKSSSKSETVFIARGEADAPDIDGRVYVRGKAKPGDFATVRIVGHADYDLAAIL